MVSILCNYFAPKRKTYLFLLDNTIEYELDQRVEVILIGYGGKANIPTSLTVLLAAYNLRKQLKAIGIEIVISFLFYSNLVNIISRFGLSGRKRQRVLISERTHTLSYCKDQGLKGKLGLQAVKFFYRRADLILPNSKLNGHSLSTDLKINTPQRVIYNPVNQPKKKLDRRAGRGKTLKVLNVANHLWKKNHTFLLKSLAKCQDITWELTLIGSGSETPSLKKLCQDMGIRQRVNFVGRADSYEYYPEADIFILTSLVEGFPNVLIEALVHGLPVISTDCSSGPRELLAPNSDFRYKLPSDANYQINDYGILVPINSEQAIVEAIRRLAYDHELFSRLQRDSLTRALDFKLDKIMKEYDKII